MKYAIILILLILTNCLMADENNYLKLKIDLLELDKSTGFEAIGALSQKAMKMGADKQGYKGLLIKGTPDRIELQLISTDLKNIPFGEAVGILANNSGLHYSWTNGYLIISSYITDTVTFTASSRVKNFLGIDGHGVTPATIAKSLQKRGLVVDPQSVKVIRTNVIVEGKLDDINTLRALILLADKGYRIKK